MSEIAETLESKNVPLEYQKALEETLIKMEEHIKENGNDYKWSFDDFELGAPLGRGKFGRVYVAREKKTKYIVAFKTMYKKEMVEGRVEKQLLREIEIQSRLNHPHILQLFTFFHDAKKIYLVLEFAAGGELYKFMKTQPHSRLNEHLSAKFIYQVADALDYCHSMSVIHRDLKPENLLLDSHGNIKLADFGWSVHAPSASRKTMCGTLDYLPPEMVRNEPYSIYVDHWCLGILLYEFLVGSPPFLSDTNADTYNKIQNLAIKWPEIITPGAKDLISKLIKKDGKLRLPLNHVKRHQWIVKNKDESLNK